MSLHTLPQAAVEGAIRTTAGASINTGIWTLVTVVITTIGLVAVAIVKQWGPWKQSDTEARNADFARLRQEIKEQNERIDKLEARVVASDAIAFEARQHVTQSDAKLETAITACELMLALVERELPQATEIELVKRLLANAATNDMGIGKAMRQIAQMHP